MAGGLPVSSRRGRARAAMLCGAGRERDHALDVGLGYERDARPNVLGHG